MALDHCVHVHACLFFQIVNVLSHVPPENAFVLEQLDEEVSWRWVVAF